MGFQANLHSCPVAVCRPQTPEPAILARLHPKGLSGTSPTAAHKYPCRSYRILRPRQRQRQGKILGKLDYTTPRHGSGKSGQVLHLRAEPGTKHSPSPWRESVAQRWGRHGCLAGPTSNQRGQVWEMGMATGMAGRDGWCEEIGWMDGLRGEIFDGG
jgi:hypothetical protein